MRAVEGDILIVPGREALGADHWQTRWSRRLKTARLVSLDSTSSAPAAAQLRATIDAARRPVVLVAHGLGVAQAVEAAARARSGAVAGGFFVAPVDIEEVGAGERTGAASRSPAHAPPPLLPLAFPSFLVASRNDPFCRFEAAEALAAAWRSLLMDAGEAGRIDAASGHGPWPEGLLLLGRLLAAIDLQASG